MNRAPMAKLGLVALAAGLAGCASPQPAAPAASPAATIALKNPGFETDPDPQRPCALGWDCSMHGDPTSFRFFHDERAPALGKRSFCFEPVTREPWALVTQGFHNPAFRGSRVRLSMAVRLEGVSGSGAGPWIHVQKTDGNKVHGQKLVNGTHAWQRIEVEVVVPADAQIIEVGAALEGRGRACLDDVRLEIVPEKKNPV